MRALHLGRSTRRRGTARATARAARSSRGRSWRGRRSCRRSTRRSRPRSRRGAAAPRGRGARAIVRGGLAWCARSGSRRPPRSAAPRGARRAASACSTPVSERSMPGVRPESSGPVCAVTAWRTSTSVVVGGSRRLRRRSAGRAGRRRGHGVDGTGARSVARSASARSLRPSSTGASPVDLLRVTDQTDLALTAADCPRPCSTPSPPTPSPRSPPRSPSPTPSAARRGVGRRRAAGPGSSTAGRASASSPATRSRRTRASGSATTAASTGCARRAGAAAGYVRWEHETNRGFLRALDGLRQRGGGDRRGRRRGPLRRVPPPARPVGPGRTEDRSPPARPRECIRMKRALDHRHHRPGRPVPRRVPERARATRSSA